MVFVVRDLATGEVRSLGVGGLTPRWSPDGRTIAYVCDFKICLIDAEGGSPRQVTHADDFYSHETLDWSPDGRWLLARGGEYLQLIELATGMTLRLGYSPTPPSRAGNLSPEVPAAGPRLLSFPQRRTVTTTPTPECHGHTHHQPSQGFDPPG